MSLINEALKKAQRLRFEQQSGAASDAPAGEIRKRPRPMRAQTIVLLIAGATVLVVFSVVITVFLINSEDTDTAFTPTVIVTPPKAAPSVDTAAPSPVIVAPAITPASSTPNASVSIAPATPTGAPPTIVVPEPVAAATTSPTLELPSTAAPAPTAAATNATTASTTAQPQAAAAAAKLAEVVDAIAPDPDLRAQQFIDALRVTGIRASGADSKVLMNDRVYRVNDIVDRTLGLRLIKVAPDSLTFSDPAGTTYTKIF